MNGISYIKIGKYFISSPEKLYTTRNHLYNDVTMEARHPTYEENYQEDSEEEGYIFSKTEFNDIICLFEILGRKFFESSYLDINIFPYDIVVFKKANIMCRVHVNKICPNSYLHSMSDIDFSINMYSTNKFNNKFLSVPFAIFPIKPSVNTSNYIFEQRIEAPGHYTIIIIDSDNEYGEDIYD